MNSILLYFLSGLGPINTHYKRCLDALLKQRSGRRNFIRSSLVESDSDSELSAMFWEAVSAAAVPEELLDAPLTESPSSEIQNGEAEVITQEHSNMPSESRSIAWDDVSMTVD